jgi:hypothetical protein
MATRGKLRDVTVPRDTASDGCEFLETNDLSHLEAFVGLELRDSQGWFYPFEGRPNVLRKRDSVGTAAYR